MNTYTETTFLVLMAVYSSNPGYGIKQFLKKETHGRVILGDVTLYEAIHALVKEKSIFLYGDNCDSNKKIDYNGYWKTKSQGRNKTRQVNFKLYYKNYIREYEQERAAFSCFFLLFRAEIAHRSV